MKTVLLFVLPLIALLLTATPLIPVFRKMVTGKQAKHRLIANLCSFFGVCLLVSEDPKSFGKALIFVVLGEGIAIYGLLIAILILNRV